MKNIITIILLVAGIAFLILGINAYQDSTANMEVLGMDISATDESGQTTAIIYFVLGVLALAGSYISWKKA